MTAQALTRMVLGSAQLAIGNEGTTMLNVGLMGAASITPRSVITPSKRMDDVRICAIASKSKERAKEFAARYGISHAYPDYESLLRSTNVDAVYIALSNELHATWAIEAAKARKHILIEKPMCLTSEEASRVIAAAEDNRVVILEAVAVQHHPWQASIREMVGRKPYGRLLGTMSTITFRLKEGQGHRFSPEKGGGVFWDEGCYWCQFLQIVGDLGAEQVGGYSTFSGPNGIDLTFKAFAEVDGVKSTFICSYEMPFDNTHVLVFENGKARIRNFFAPMFGEYRLKIDIAPEDGDRQETIVFEPRNYFYEQLRRSRGITQDCLSEVTHLIS
ncbi:MAG: Gfo/Idh/MocA family oxidoreductase [Acidobacteriia bacterium]|nr:Gfo/Idh/MocA family oxidoreductase [Terriglobia bacterium]